MTDLRLIAAVGRRGQIGLGDRLPWREPEDLRWFRAQTLGHAVIMGARTARSVGELPGREVYVWDGLVEPETFLVHVETMMEARYRHRPIWVAGGEHTYRRFLPLVTRCVVTLVDYDGPSDAWMPDLWERRI